MLIWWLCCAPESALQTDIGVRTTHQGLFQIDEAAQMVGNQGANAQADKALAV